MATFDSYGRQVIRPIYTDGPAIGGYPFEMGGRGGRSPGYKRGGHTPHRGQMSLGIESGFNVADLAGEYSLVGILFGSDKKKAQDKAADDAYWDQWVQSKAKEQADNTLKAEGLATPDEVLAQAKLAAKLSEAGIDVKKIEGKIDGLTDEEMEAVFGTKNKKKAKAKAVTYIVTPKGATAAMAPSSGPSLALGSVATSTNYAWLPWLLGVGALVWWLTSQKGS